MTFNLQPFSVYVNATNGIDQKRINQCQM